MNPYLVEQMIHERRRDLEAEIESICLSRMGKKLTGRKDWFDYNRFLVRLGKRMEKMGAKLVKRYGTAPGCVCSACSKP